MIRKIPSLVVIGLLALAQGACDQSRGGKSDEPARPQLTAASGATLIGNCESLIYRLDELPETEITASSEVAVGILSVGGAPIRAHCLVTGKTHERTSVVDGNTYAIGFEMRLPLEWNGRFFHQGNGGIDGRVVTAVGAAGPASLTNALRQGFAVLSSDGGHRGSLGPLFGIDPEARVDYGYAAVQKLTPVAKELIAIAYGKKPDRSYIGGCSNGGRHVFNAFARSPGEYDGYLAGAPGFRLPYAAIANIFGAQQYATVATNPADLSTAFSAEERELVVAEILASCDKLDGASDGQVHDVEACRSTFSLEKLVTCSGARNGTCLSAAQKEAIGAVFSGAETGADTKFYAPFPFDTGIASEGYARWEFEAPMTRDSGAVGFIWGVPPANPAVFDGPDFAINGSIDDMLVSITASDKTYSESSVSFMIPPDPFDLSVVRDRGAKIMVYHGVSDPIFSPFDTVDWYKKLSANNNGDASEFARLYLVPGMGHCAGGPAVDQFDLLTPLVQWVEQGIAPSDILASARGDGNAGGTNIDLPADWDAGRTRPLCQYPLVARYDESGDIESAASFSCKP